MKLQESIQLLRATNNKFVGTAQRHDVAFESVSFPRLTNLIERMSAVKAARPPFCPDAYLRVWTNYQKNKATEIQGRVRRFLCWHPKVGASLEFLEYLEQLSEPLSANAIQGLVYVQHTGWSDGETQGRKLQMVRTAIKKYRGRNRLLKKWKENIKVVISPEAPSLAAKKMFDGLQPVDKFCADWGFNEQTRFISEVVAECSRLCFRSFHQLGNDAGDYFVDEILTWKNFDLAVYKRIISQVVMTDKFFKEEKFQEKILGHIVGDSRLGDPRLPANSQNWVSIEPEAKSRLLQLLSRADIVFFFDHVMTKQEDRHGRKEFWLQFVPALKQSRPLLNATDKIRLYSTIRRQGKKMLHFGETKGQHSAFLLDFGRVIVVEFNGVGAVYMYEDRDRRRLFPDFYTDEPYTDTKLKQPAYAVYRKAHVGNWQWSIRQALAHYGIRPS